MTSATTAGPRPWPRGPLLLHLGCALPLVVLAVWFGLIDRLPFGEGRCSSCGVEGYVIAAHVAAAACLAAIVVVAAAARRQVREGIPAPGRVTVGALAAVALYVGASLVWHKLFGLPAVGALIASIVLFPAAAIWWVLAAVAWRRDPQSDAELRRRLDRALATAWVSLVLLLPGIFAWVWTDRVEWLVF